MTEDIQISKFITKNLNNQILDVDSIDGYSMLINKNKFKDIF